jgi:hypothetical protein
MTSLHESNLSRVWQHVESAKPIALLTAFRGEYPREENIRRNKKLAVDVRGLGYGYFFVDGYWIENAGTEDEAHVAEDTLFVIAPEGTDAEFVSHMVRLVAAYDQESALIKTLEGANLYDKNGDIVFNVGDLKPGKMGEIYTQLRKKTGTFVFEAERDDLSWLQRLAGMHKTA